MAARDLNPLQQGKLKFVSPWIWAHWNFACGTWREHVSLWKSKAFKPKLTGARNRTEKRWVRCYTDIAFPAYCLPIKQGKRDNFFWTRGRFHFGKPSNPAKRAEVPAAQQCRGLINKATPGRTVARPFFRFRLHACAFYVLLPILQRFGRDTIAGSTRGKITEKQTNLCCKFCSYFLKTSQEQLQTWKNLQAMWKASSAEIECMMRSDSACWFVRMMIFMMPCSRFAVSTCTKIKTTDQKTHSYHMLCQVEGVKKEQDPNNDNSTALCCVSVREAHPAAFWLSTLLWSIFSALLGRRYQQKSEMIQP